MNGKTFSAGKFSVLLILSLVFLLTGCAIQQIKDQLSKDESELSRVSGLRKSYCIEGERLYAEAEAKLAHARHEISEVFHANKGASMLTDFEAVLAKAEYIVTGDKALLELKEYKGVEIVSVEEFLKLFSK